tara:strand:- start:10911 stop:11381 length:471 start_codon:yes stop_codon:yes gene_type:complete
MFDTCFINLMKHEGGYVNDPDDPGGETKFGISKRAYPDVDIKNLTEDEAKGIYRRDYWDKCRVESISAALRPIYFDMCVNMGKSRAVKILQNAANNKNKEDIDVDGGLGPATRKALENVEIERARAFRVKYYADLVEKKESLQKFYYGWFKRSLEV